MTAVLSIAAAFFGVGYLAPEQAEHARVPVSEVVGADAGALQAVDCALDHAANCTVGVGSGYARCHCLVIVNIAATLYHYAN